MKYNMNSDLKKHILSLKKNHLFSDIEKKKCENFIFSEDENNLLSVLDFVTLIQSSPRIDRIDLSFKEINISQLKKIIIKTKPSNLNSFINNRVKSGKLSTDLELYFDKNLKIKNFIARG